MIRSFVALALLAAGSAAVAADAPAGKIQTLRGAAVAERCRGALFVPAGKINTHGHGGHRLALRSRAARRQSRAAPKSSAATDHASGRAGPA